MNPLIIKLNNPLEVCKFIEEANISEIPFDCFFLVEGRKIGAHRIILAMVSPFLKDILKNQKNVCSEHPYIIPLDGESYKTVKDLIDIVYCREPKITAGEDSLIMATAKLLGIKINTSVISITDVASVQRTTDLNLKDENISPTSVVNNASERQKKLKNTTAEIDPTRQNLLGCNETRANLLNNVTQRENKDFIEGISIVNTMTTEETDTTEEEGVAELDGIVTEQNVFQGLSISDEVNIELNTLKEGSGNSGVLNVVEQAETDAVDECRICQVEVADNGNTDDRLVAPCKCKGSIKFIHKTCLIDWITKSGNKNCEICRHSFKASMKYKYSRLGSLKYFIQNRQNRWYMKKAFYCTLICLLLIFLILFGLWLIFINMTNVTEKNKEKTIYDILFFIVFIIFFSISMCHNTYAVTKIMLEINLRVVQVWKYWYNRQIEVEVADI